MSKDIRPELHTLLKDTNEELRALNDRHKREMAELEARQKSEILAVEQTKSNLEALIDNLDTRFGSATPPPEPKPKNPPVAEFLIDVLGTIGPMTKEELKDHAVAAGYFGPDDTPGRSVHFTVINLLRGERIIQGEDGKYFVPPKVGAPKGTVEYS